MLGRMQEIRLGTTQGRLQGIRTGIMQCNMQGIRLARMQFRIRVLRMLEIRMGLLLFQELLIRMNGNENVVAARVEGNEADESLDKITILEKENERLLRAVVSQDIMSILQNLSVVDTSNLQTVLERTEEKLETCITKKENEYDVLWNNWYIKFEECKYDKISCEKAYNGMQHQIKRLQVQLRDLKGKSMNTQCSSNTLDPLSQKLDDENPSLEFQVMSLEKENEHLKVENFVPNKHVKESVRTKPINVSQPHVVTNKDVNSKKSGLSSTGVESTAKTRRPQPRSNTKNDRVPYASKSSFIKNNEVKVEEHPRNLLSLINQKHMSSECINIKLVVRNDKSEVLCATCKQCLITTNHDVYVFNYVNGMNSCEKNQSANVLNIANQKKHKENVKKTKKLGSKERLASPRPSKPRTCLRWNLQANGFQILLLFLAGYRNLLIVRRLRLLQAYDRESEAAHQLHLEVYRNFGQLCDSNLEVEFKRNTCFVRNLDGVDLLKGNRSTNLYTINLYERTSASPICLMARATSTKSWLWHQYLSHLNFDTINELAKDNLVTGLLKFKYLKDHLCPSCEQGKSKKSPHKPKPVPNSKNRLHLLHMDLCGPIRVENINEKRDLCYHKNDHEDIGKLGVKAMDFEQHSSKPELQEMTSRQISSGLDLTYAPSIIASKKPTERELELLF
ncbi:retrovirus-related pol polyprotein from transposon TNT 1-94 [Tanacetum coccineum]